jgi:hypothetical protein
MNRYALIGLALFLGACADSIPGPAEPGDHESAVVVELGRTFELRVGERARLGPAGPVITFRGVPADSRCPIDAICLWEGDAVVDLLLKHGSTQRPIELHTHMEPGSATVGQLVLVLEALTPAPMASSPTSQREYSARLRLENP